MWIKAVKTHLGWAALVDITHYVVRLHRRAPMHAKRASPSFPPALGDGLALGLVLEQIRGEIGGLTTRVGPLHRNMKPRYAFATQTTSLLESD
jgi:hypothetical protein